MKIPRHRSLAVRLSFWYLLVMGVLIALAGVYIFGNVERRLHHEVDRSLSEMGREIVFNWLRTRGLTWPQAVAEAENRFRDTQPFIQVVRLPEKGRTGLEVAARSRNVSGDAFLLQLGQYLDADREGEEFGWFTTIHSRALNSYPVRVVLMDMRGPEMVQVGISLGTMQGQLRSFSLLMVLAGVLLLLLVAFGGYAIIRRALAAVGQVSRAAREISADDLSLRIDPSGRKDEIGALIETFNGMISRLESSVNRIRQFSGDVSHELRTPLTVIRGEIEVLLRRERGKEEYLKTLNSILEETGQMERIIEDLILLSRLDANRKLARMDAVDLADLVREVCERRLPAASQKRIALSFDRLESVTVVGDRSLLERMFQNILENAIRYTHPGGRVEVSTIPGDDGGLLQVKDTGIGIPPSALPFIFDRFFVVEPSRSKESGGVGLGLAIAKSIVEVHHAKILVDSTPDEGSTFTVQFPPLPSEAMPSAEGMPAET